MRSDNNMDNFIARIFRSFASRVTFPARRRRSFAGSLRGFTLIEIMLALSITALVMSMVYSSLRGAGSSLKSLSVRNELYRSAYALLDEMGRELAAAYLSPHSWTGRSRTYFFV